MCGLEVKEQKGGRGGQQGGREGAESSPADSFQTWNNWMISVPSFWLRQWGCSLRTRVSVFSLYLNVPCGLVLGGKKMAVRSPSSCCPWLRSAAGTCFPPVRQLVCLWQQWAGPWPVPCKDLFVGFQPPHSCPHCCFQMDLVLLLSHWNCWAEDSHVTQITVGLLVFYIKGKSQGSVASNLGCNSHLTPLPATCLSDRR